MPTAITIAAPPLKALKTAYTEHRRQIRQATERALSRAAFQARTAVIEAAPKKIKNPPKLRQAFLYRVNRQKLTASIFLNRKYINFWHKHIAGERMVARPGWPGLLTVLTTPGRYRARRSRLIRTKGKLDYKTRTGAISGGMFTVRSRTGKVSVTLSRKRRGRKPDALALWHPRMTYRKRFAYYKIADAKMIPAFNAELDRILSGQGGR